MASGISSLCGLVNMSQAVRWDIMAGRQTGSGWLQDQVNIQSNEAAALGYIHVLWRTGVLSVSCKTGLIHYTLETH